MALSLYFADSFAHYDQAGIPLKWDTAGGTIETNPAHVRTGPQSLRIQSGDSPTLNVLNGGGYTTIGFAWQTESLAGETICSQVASFAGNQVQLYLVQNSNGSISLWSGQGPTLIATSAVGVLTVGPFWYIEFGSVINPGTATPAALVTVTSSPGGVATQVINASGFSTGQIQWDTLTFGGPSGPSHAWVADFYFLDLWDSTGDPFQVAGAPKIYGLNKPIADGVQLILPINPPPPSAAFPGTAPPLWSQIDTIPEQTATFIYISNENPPGTLQAMPIVGQGFQFDVSSVPSGSTIFAVQLTALAEFVQGDRSIVIAPEPAGLNGFSNQTANDFQQFSATHYNVTAIFGAFQFFEVSFQADNNGNPFTLAHFSGATPIQIGPLFNEPS